MRSLQIEGHPTSINSLHAALVAAATAHIDEVHRAQCTPETQVMFARMDCHGVGEDINQAVRMFAVALAQRRQLVLLPPAPHTARDECKVPASLSLTAAKPWHWLAGQALPMESIFVLSSCHKELLRKQPHIMEAIAESGAGNATSTAVRLGATALAAVSRESTSLWRSHLAVSRHVPRVFQRQGLLWWFQVLTTYLVRINGALANLLQGHPAMQPFVSSQTMSNRGTAAVDDAALAGRWQGLGWAVKCSTRYCDGLGPGWAPTARFDAGVHLRMGDSCRSGPTRYAQHVRRCDVNLTHALRRLAEAGVRNGTLFVASDSQHIIDQIDAGLARPFNVSYLRINRARFETAAGTEKLELPAIRLKSLLEALMDMVLLARSSLLAGKMMSNFPRAALQMRVQLPARRSHARAYIALDDRPWCTRTSCREPFPSARDQQAAMRRELARNPSIP